MPTKNKRGKIKSHFGLPYIPLNKLNLLRLQEKNKNVAKCLFCSKVLKNVGYNRLLGHMYAVVQVSNCRILLFLFIQIFVRLCIKTIFLSITFNILASNSKIFIDFRDFLCIQCIFVLSVVKKYFSRSYFIIIVKYCLIYETESCSYVFLFIFWRSFVLYDVYPIEELIFLLFSHK